MINRRIIGKKNLYFIFYRLKSGRTRGQGRCSRQPKEQQPSDQAQTTQNVHWRPDYFAKNLFGTMKITPAIQRTISGIFFIKPPEFRRNTTRHPPVSLTGKFS